jgi:predicted ATPase
VARIDGGGSAARNDDSVPSGGRPVRTGVFVCNGDYWTLGLAGSNFSLKDIKGLSYIQRLLQYPAEEFHALDLISGPGGSGAAPVDPDQAAQLKQADLSVGGLGDSGEMLDARAKQEYKQRLLDLKEELDDLLERGNHERAAEVESEIDFLVREISRAVGLGGRERRAGSAAERARLNVTRAIKAALQRISERHQALGGLLEHGIKTGSFCRYASDPHFETVWQFSPEGAATEVAPAAPGPFLLRHETSFLRALQGRSAFVGREAERSILRRCMEQAIAGAGTVVMVSGAPGVGKTRISSEFAVEATKRGFRAFAGSCYDRDDSVPFLPFVEIFEAALAQAPSPEAFRRAIGADAAEIARLMPQLRRLFPDIPQPLDLSPEQSRRILFTAVIDLLSRAAQVGPILLLFEDLHWADEGTLSLLNQVARALAEIPVMLVGTFRKHELDPGGSLAKALDELNRLRLIERIELQGLPLDGVAQMLRALSAGAAPPPAVVNSIHSATDGNPFFIEELYRHLVERGKLLDDNHQFRRDLKLEDIDIPQSLRLVIGRRLVHLDPEIRKILGAAAVVGRSFTFELLEASTGTDADTLLDALEEAERAGLVASTLDYPEAQFRFSHELTRQAVLAELSGPRRQRMHLNVANAIERIHSDTVEDHAADLAHHLWQAGNAADVGRTVSWLERAAKRAREQSAYEAALHDLQSAIELVVNMPDSELRKQRELDLQIARGVTLVAMKGWHAAEVGESYHRARELCRDLNGDPRLFSVLFGLWGFHLVRGDHKLADRLGADLIELKQSTSDASLEMVAHWTAGCSSYFLGNLADARKYLERGIGLYDRQRHRSLAFLYGQDPGMCCLAFNASTLWRLGYPDQALKSGQDALALARELVHPFSLVWCLTNVAIFRATRRDWPATIELIDEGLAVCEERGFESLSAAFVSLQSVALAMQGKVDRARSLLSGVGSLPSRLSGQLLYMPWHLTMLAEAYGNLGQTERALAFSGRGFAIMDQTDERHYEAEMYRVKGELLLKQAQTRNLTPPNQLEAQECFRKALEIARQQSARSFELRAAMSLSRSMNHTGSRSEARIMLAEIYGWFTEGFDTRDLQEARALLADLA